MLIMRLYYMKCHDCHHIAQKA
eukprot:COSAG01_NODE_25921_length_729_cov_0.917460_2_plen_21_part_01